MLDKIEEIVKAVCVEKEVAFYDFEVKSTQKGKVLSIFITKTGGVTLGDCASVSRQIGHILEEQDLIPDKYFLEVSSPGIERVLKFKKHYIGAINELVKISYTDEEQKKVVTIGKLMEVLPEYVNVEVDQQMVQIPFSAIKKARTYFDFKNKETT